MKILVLNGPNLNLLGEREPGIYGEDSLEQLEKNLDHVCQEEELEVDFFQSNYEGALLDALHGAKEKGYEGIIMNPGAFTHYSIALRDGIASIDLPVVEVHISNVYAREEFRSKSVTAPVSIGQITGFGLYGYELALLAIKQYIQRRG
ncbi:type II 3-dehydroquinate dehydratase [Lederbergia sp. NSJ-179]|uniref:type II 3-dehydroquinate dehydratase n=1 Tax=Lederbergia sp. NSJ-179 TaxID=2931402 RepID=UPI001FD0DDD0|nr:type II 3-dehydroquinate dehydratase [Lederbergia sp. NSJ-179]MCJ7839343.1 type II 3-dehydroquinate dehydratase [Lederbergia sp. NSJ-179]